MWQTAVHPAVALEMMATGEWKGEGVKGPEAFSADPFLAAAGRARRAMVDRGTLIAALTKADVERLLADYDADPIGALTRRSAGSCACPMQRGPSCSRQPRSMPADDSCCCQATQASLDRLAAELNERRSLEGPA